MSCKESRAETDSEQLRLSHWNRWIAGLRIWPQPEAYNLAKHSSSSSSTVVPPVTRDSRQKSPQLSASASAAPLQTFKFATKMQSERNNEQVPLFFPLRPSGPAAGTSPSLTSKVLFILRPLGPAGLYPGGRALAGCGRRPAARYPGSGHTRRYSSCH